MIKTALAGAPILNEAGIAQITPGSGYPGLTDAYKGITEPNTEPGKYYPQPSTRTLVRLIPNDVVQVSAALHLLHSDGCQRVAAWQFGGTIESVALLKAVSVRAPHYKMTYYSSPPLGTDTKTYIEYAHGLAVAGVHCAILVGTVTPAAVALTTELHEQLPEGSAIVGSSGFCTPRWLHGIPTSLVKSVAAGLYCMTPALPVQKYINGRRFIHVFRLAYHHGPSAYDYYGYEAAQLVIRAVRDLVPGEDPRTTVTSSILGDLVSGELGWYAFDGGDSSSSVYGVDTFVDGIPRHHTTVTP